jgi:hypothetical protein
MERRRGRVARSLHAAGPAADRLEASSSLSPERTSVLQPPGPSPLRGLPRPMYGGNDSSFDGSSMGTHEAPFSARRS